MSVPTAERPESATPHAGSPGWPGLRLPPGASVSSSAKRRLSLDSGILLLSHRETHCAWTTASCQGRGPLLPASLPAGTSVPSPALPRLGLQPVVPAFACLAGCPGAAGSSVPGALAQRGGRAPPSPLLASGPGSAWCPLAAHSPSPERYGWACAGPAASEGQPRAGPGAGRVQGPGCGRPHVGTVVSAASQRLFGRGSWIDPRAPNR